MPCSKALVIAAMLACMAGAAVPAHATWTKVEATTVTCAANPCSTGVKPTNAGDVGIIITNLSGTSGTQSISSVSGGGSWTMPAGCVNSGGSAGDIGCAYTLLTAKTAITVTWNDGGAIHLFGFLEVASTASSSALDAVGQGYDSTCTSCAGVALSLSGTNDVIAQGISPDNSASSISGGAGYTAACDTHSNCWAYALNATNGSAPTWSTTSGTSAVTGIAIKEVSAAGCTPTLMLLGIGRCG